MVSIITLFDIYIILLIGFKIIFQQTDIIRTIKDPEKPATLEDLSVVYENGVEVSIQNNEFYFYCSLRLLIVLTFEHQKHGKVYINNYKT